MIKSLSIRQIKLSEGESHINDTDNIIRVHMHYKENIIRNNKEAILPNSK